MKHEVVCLLVGIAGCIVLSGCYSFRNSETVSVKDIGDRIETKRRYTLTGVNIRDDKQDASVDEKHRLLKAMFPGVFADDGIPFILNYTRSIGTRRYDWLGSRGWTEALAACTLGIYPKQTCLGMVNTFRVEMNCDSSVHADFDLVSTTECADAIFPTAFSTLNGKPDVGDLRAYWTERKVSGGAEGTKLSNAMIYKWASMRPLDFGDPLVQAAFAYGVASKLKELEDSGEVDSMLKRQDSARSKAPPHRVVAFKRENDSDFTYSFALELEMDGGDSEVAEVLKEFQKNVIADYAVTNPNENGRLAIVNFSDVKVESRRISGLAVVVSIKVVSLSYDANTRRGKLLVRFNPGQVDESRKWVLENIAMLARDKNIMLTAGVLPPPGNFSVVKENVDGNMLEIEFKTE